MLSDLSKEYGCSTYVIRRVLKLNDVEPKSFKEVTKEVNFRNRFKQRKYGINYDYFKSWNSEMSYILGFIYADGYVSNGVRINLQVKDKCLLENIKEALQYEGNIVITELKSKNKTYSYAYLDITSLDIANDLKDIGLYPNKSKTITFPNIPENFELDFIRGYFDGDGCIEVKRQIHKKKNSDTYQLRLRICSGSFDFLNSLQAKLSKYGLKPKIVRDASRGLYDITYSTKESYLIYDLFYKNNSMCLERKKLKFEEGFKLRESL